MVTYDGTVGMCCHDWGAQHAVGFINKTAFENDKVTDELEKKIINADKGFALLKNAKKPKKYNNPPKKISNLKKIWIGEELYSVRKKHFEKKIDDLEVCKHCSFKDTYSWEKI
jgi:superfamily II helicase